MALTAFLLNPPSLPGTTANREGAVGMGALSEREGGFCYPPHLLATAGAVLRQEGWQVSGLDAVALGLSMEETLARLPKADLLVMLCSYATLAAERAFLNRLRERKPLQQVLVVGPALSYPQVAHALNDLADLLLAGEPELALPAAARRLLAGDLRPGQVVNPYALAQTAYHPDGRLVDLDALPVPAWDIFLSAGHRYPFLTILSSRGCPAGCRFCPYVAAQGRELRYQSPERTAYEMAELVRCFHPPHVIFRDPVFAFDRNRVLALCAALRHRRLGITWECESRPEHFDARLLRAMQASGCTTVKVGLETTDPELLVAIGRVPDVQAAQRYVQQTTEVIQSCRRLRLLCRVYVMVGLPGQTLESVQRTAHDLWDMRPARLHVKPFRWYPGLGLPQAGAEDVDRQVALLTRAHRQSFSRWRRLARKLIG